MGEIEEELVVLRVVICCTGLGNNDPEWIAQQHFQLGVSAAIVDDVAAVVSYLHTFPITSHLTEPNEQHLLSMGSALPIEHRRKAVAA